MINLNSRMKNTVKQALSGKHGEAHPLKRIFSILLGTTILTTTILAASLPQMTASVYAANPKVTLGSALKEKAGQTGAQKVWYGGRSWVVIAYKGKNGEGTDLGLYPANSITLLQDEVTETSKFNDVDDSSATNNSNAYGYLDPDNDTPSELRSFIESQYLTGDSPYIYAKEQEMIVPRTLEGGGGNYQADGYDSNKMKGQGVSAAKVWPLSVAEAKKLEETDILNSNQWVWLRSPGVKDYWAEYFWPGMGIYLSGGSVKEARGVRPALHLNHSAIILTLNTDDGYRLVAKDDGISVSVTGSDVERDGETVTVPYSVTGDHDKAYILITDKAYDADGAEIKLYTELTNAGNGKGSFTLPDSFDTSWKAYIVAENTSAGSTHADFAGISSAFTMPKVATPTFSPAGGSYSSSKRVEISCETDGAEIYYTTDGTAPTKDTGEKYTSAISVTRTTTIKAIAVKEGMTDSEVAEAVYRISTPEPEPDTPKETAITVPDNKPMAVSTEPKGEFNITYAHEIPFYGKGKITPEYFGGLSVSQGNATYIVTKIKVNKKNKRIQITGLQGADKDTVKKVKKATKGSNGLPFKCNPYYVRDTDKVTPKFKKSGAVASVKVAISGKDYKAKKTEYDYNEASKLILFKGENLAGSWAVK